MPDGRNCVLWIFNRFYVVALSSSAFCRLGTLQIPILAFPIVAFL